MSIDKQYFESAGLKFRALADYEIGTATKISERVLDQYRNVEIPCRAWINALAKTSGGQLFLVGTEEIFVFADGSCILASTTYPCHRPDAPKDYLTRADYIRIFC